MPSSSPSPGSPGPVLARLAPWPLLLSAVLLSSSGVGLTGCGAAYSTLQPGKVTPRGAVRAQAGAAFGAAPGQLIALYAAGEEAADGLVGYLATGDRGACDAGSDKSGCITAQDLAPVLDAVALQVAAPAASADVLFGMRYGLLPRTDIGIRYGVSGWLVDSRVQVLGDPEVTGPGRSTQLSLGLGVGRKSFEYPSYLGKVAEYLGLDDNYRWDFRFPVIGSLRFGEFGYLYGGAGYILSRWHFDLDPDFAYIDYLPDGSLADTAQEIEDSFRDATAKTFAGTDTDGYIHQVTGLLGGMLGYKYLYVGVELNIIRYWYSLSILHQEKSHSGFIFYPAVTLMGEF